MLSLFIRLQTIVDRIPDEVFERLPADIQRQLREGTLDKIPQDAIDKLPAGMRDSIPPGLVEAAASNPLFAIIGVLALLGFVYGIVKSAIKAAVFFGVLAALAWFLFLK